MLLERDYRPGMIDSAIQSAQSIPRKKAINFIGKTPSNKRPVFVTSFDPRLPNIQSITMKHWRAMNRLDPHMSEVFPEPPVVAFKRPQISETKISEPT